MLLDINNINPTLQRLLQATEELISEIGCEKTTMKEIMKRSGISKGGIYHYVESKNELYSFVLSVRLERIHQKFLQLSIQQSQSLPVGAEQLVYLLYQLEQTADDLIRQIFIYLLSKTNHLPARQAIRHFYRQLIQSTTQWIEKEQKMGRCSLHLDVSKIADLFVLLSLGMHIRQSMPSETGIFSSQDFTRFVQGIVGK